MNNGNFKKPHGTEGFMLGLISTKCYCANFLTVTWNNCNLCLIPQNCLEANVKEHAWNILLYTQRSTAAGPIITTQRLRSSYLLVSPPSLIMWVGPFRGAAGTFQRCVDRTLGKRFICRLLNLNLSTPTMVLSREAYLHYIIFNSFLEVVSVSEKRTEIK